MLKRRQLGILGLTLALVLGALGVWPGGSAGAQTNLLVNGGMENPYQGQGAPTQTAPNGWNLWVGAGTPEAFPHTDPIQVIDGAASWNIKQGGGVFTAAGYQRVGGIAPGTRLRFSASAWLYTCNDREYSCIIPEWPHRRSDPSAGASVRVGIDPTGGTDPNSPSIVWSGSVAPYDQWATPSVVADAQGDAVTVFVYATQAQGLLLNNVYWDGAQLINTNEPVTPGGTGGTPGTPGQDAAPPPPPVQEAPFVVAQGVRPDGSIVHIIQEGDTLYSIAYAYAEHGVTRESIAELNEGIQPNTPLLVPGQELIIMAPGSVDPLTGRPSGGGGDSGGAPGTPVRTIIGGEGQAGGAPAATPVPTITPRGQVIGQPPTPTAQAVAEAGGVPDAAMLDRVLQLGEGVAVGLGRGVGPGAVLVFEYLRRIR